MAEAETEAAEWKDEAAHKKKEYEAEMELQHQAADLMRVKDVFNE